MAIADDGLAVLGESKQSAAAVADNRTRLNAPGWCVFLLILRPCCDAKTGVLAAMRRCSTMVQLCSQWLAWRKQLREKSDGKAALPGRHTEAFVEETKKARLAVLCAVRSRVAAVRLLACRCGSVLLTNLSTGLLFLLCLAGC